MYWLVTYEAMIGNIPFIVGQYPDLQSCAAAMTAASEEAGRYLKLACWKA